MQCILVLKTSGFRHSECAKDFDCHLEWNLEEHNGTLEKEDEKNDK